MGIVRFSDAIGEIHTAQAILVFSRTTTKNGIL
jgi:hypothetical protein